MPVNTSFLEGANEHMGDSRHIELLKQGAKVWNKMRRSAHSKEKPDLSGIDLRGIKLEKINLESVNLEGADLEGAELIEANLNSTNLVAANLTGATLVGSYLIRANLREANLSRAILMTADLSAANLHRSILRGADLSFLSLTDADLSKTDLTEADLCGTNLSRSDLSEADLSSAKAGQTIFGDLDLSEVKGLHTIKHYAPSTLGIDTILRSRGNLPDIFLHGVGLPDDAQRLLKNGNAIFRTGTTVFDDTLEKKLANVIRLNPEKGINQVILPKKATQTKAIRDAITTTVRGTRDAEGEVLWKQLGAAWLEDTIDKSTKEGVLNVKTLSGHLDGLGKTVNVVFNKRQIKAIDDMVKVLKVTRPGGSGLVASAFAKGTELGAGVSAIKRLATGDVIGATGLGALAISPSLYAKLATDPVGNRILRAGIVLKPGSKGVGPFVARLSKAIIDIRRKELSEIDRAGKIRAAIAKGLGQEERKPLSISRRDIERAGP